MWRWSAKRSSASPSIDPARPDADAGLRYEAGRARAGHMEAWSLWASDLRSRRGVWLKWSVWAGTRAPERAVAEAWAVCFGGPRGHVATKTTIPFERSRFGKAALDVEIDGARLTADRARGRVESGGRSVCYDLEVRSVLSRRLGGPPGHVARLPTVMRASPLPSAIVSGRVEIAGETWTVENWPATVGHTWGAGHSTPFAWGHCNQWVGDDVEDLLLEGLTAPMRLGRALAPVTTLVTLRSGGTCRTSSTGLAAIFSHRGSVTPRRWTFRARAAGVEVDGEMWADTDDLVGLFDPHPDGTLAYDLGTTLAQAEVTLRLAGGPRRRLLSERAFLEIGTHDRHHGVGMYV